MHTPACKHSCIIDITSIAGILARMTEQLVLCAAWSKALVIIAIFFGSIATLMMPVSISLLSKNTTAYEQVCPKAKLLLLLWSVASLRLAIGSWISILKSPMQLDFSLSIDKIPVLSDDILFSLFRFLHCIVISIPKRRDSGINRPSGLPPKKQCSPARRRCADFASSANSVFLGIIYPPSSSPR